MRKIPRDAGFFCSGSRAASRYISIPIKSHYKAQRCMRLYGYRYTYTWALDVYVNGLMIG